jgi:hypothetical protein
MPFHGNLRVRDGEAKESVMEFAEVFGYELPATVYVCGSFAMMVQLAVMALYIVSNQSKRMRRSTRAGDAQSAAQEPTSTGDESAHWPLNVRSQAG